MVLENLDGICDACIPADAQAVLGRLLDQVGGFDDTNKAAVLRRRAATRPGGAALTLAEQALRLRLS